MENLSVYIAPRFFEHELEKELQHFSLPILEQRGRLFLVNAKARSLAWAQNTWLEPFFIPIQSIGDAAKRLKEIQRNWHCHAIDHYRRANLIAEKLPFIRYKNQAFLEECPQSSLGAWTLWDENTLLVSATCSSPYADGECTFVENKIDPPSRAYLKLWEVFTLFQYFPKKNDLAIDLGACPGGWTWVMASCGSRVFAIDKSALDPQVASMNGVDFCQGSGFALNPKETGRVEWLLSDMACYPEKLYEYVIKWIELDLVENCVLTLKLQGDTDYNMLDLYREINNSALIHLSCNKHELTWIYGNIKKNHKKI